MRIYDCILFNGEIDILQLRLRIMDPYIDEFLIVEANQTFSGCEKPSIFNENIELFEKYIGKIKYQFITEFPPTNNAWEREHFLRDQLRVLVSAGDNDLVIISDADEIINIPGILPKLKPSFAPVTIKLKTYYFYYNCQSNEVIDVSLISKFGDIKNMFVGDRTVYNNFKAGSIEDMEGENGAHFTYQFGKDVSKYIKKIKSFSHQEFNNPYYLNEKRIKKCIRYKIDLFERRNFEFKCIRKEEFSETFYLSIQSLNAKDCLTHSQTIQDFVVQCLDPYFLKHVFKKWRLKIPYLKRKIAEKFSLYF